MAPSAANKDHSSNGTEVMPTEPEAEKEGMAEPMDGVAQAGYRVKAGQSLWAIAAEVLGDGALYDRILQVNPALNGRPDMIRPGQVINLP